jgi:hypothetical protein
MSLEDMVSELAAGVRFAIEGTDERYLKEDPEGAFTDLACRLIRRLGSKLTIVPVPSREEQIRTAQAAAATRIFDIFTRRMLDRPGCSIDTRMSATGTFQVVVKTPSGTKLHFGESLQDAYAQAAQTLSFDDSL